MSVSYCGWLHRTVAFMDSLKQIVWCRGFCTFFLFPAFHRQKLRHFDTSKPLPMMDGDRTWHTCEVAVRVSRCEPDKRNHQRICKGNMIQTDQDWFRRIQVLLLRQSEETSWTDRERQWSKMIGVCSCQLLKRSCCAMSLNESRRTRLAVQRMTPLRLLATSSTRNGRILWVSEPKCMRDVPTKDGSWLAVA